ncbi:GtrA family protein [Vibrio pectenicida]|uniref:GtrA family protein n=3 Tax=Vibrio pectenicida TaxID=62763 RepID=A0A3R9KZX9_9VIBR|nr:GtrA family protein [Vibrio pectenicida]
MLGERVQKMPKDFRVAKKPVKFLFVGMLNTIFGYLVFIMCIGLGLYNSLALLFSFIIGASFNFFTTGTLVFGNVSKSKFFPFVFIYLFLYFLNLVLLTILERSIDNPIFSQLILIMPMAVISYFCFNKLFKVCR